jgi:hypothetical protein
MSRARQRARTGGLLSTLLLLCVAAMASSQTLFGDDERLWTMLEVRNKSNRAVVVTLAGTGALGAIDGDGKNAQFWSPSDVALLPNGRSFLVADSRNHKIRMVTIPAVGRTQSQANADDPYAFVNANLWLDGTATVSTLAGSGAGYRDGQATNAKFNLPTGIAVHPDGSWAAVAGAAMQTCHVFWRAHARACVAQHLGIGESHERLVLHGRQVQQQDTEGAHCNG